MSTQFAVTLKRWAGHTLAEYDQVRRSIALRLFRAVILDTPVLTGRLRANWITNAGNAELTTVDDVDPTGAKTIASAFEAIADSGFGDTLVMSNSLPYAYRIEYDGWSHTKAPAGMVRKNVTLFKDLLKNRMTLTTTTTDA